MQGIKGNAEQCRHGRSQGGPAHLTIVEESLAGEEVRALYRTFRTRFARSDIPGIVKCFATSPSLLSNMIDLAADFLFVDGHLTRQHKEMIATFISSQNECAYCAESHGDLLLAHGGTSELLCALRTGTLDAECLSKPERALLRFVLTVNSASRFITRAVVEETMQDGWTEAQLSEAVHLAALFAAFNRIANAFGLASPHSPMSEASHV